MSALPPSAPAHWQLDDFMWSPEMLTAMPRGATTTEDDALRLAFASFCEADGEAPPAALPGHASTSGRAAQPVCQIPSCGASLHTLRPYHKRAKLCAVHLLADECLLAGGGRGRFCQRCHRLQPLRDFDGAKHTCAAALAAYNARRHARLSGASGAATKQRGSGSDTPPGSTSDGSGGSAAAAAAATARASPSDATPPDAGVAPLLSWLRGPAAEWSAATAAAATAVHAAHSASQAQGGAAQALLAQPLLLLRPTTAHADVAAAISAAALCGFTVHIKLPATETPVALPPAASLRDAFAAALPDAAAPLAVALRRGCVLLSCDTLRPIITPPPGEAERVAAALRTAWAGDEHEAAAARACVLAGGERAALRLCDAAATVTSAPPPAPPALALCVAAPPAAGVALRVPLLRASAAGAVSYDARFGGATLQVQLDGDGDALQLRGLPGGAEGAVVIEARAASSGEGDDVELRVSPPRLLLLCADVALRQQVATTAAGVAEESQAALQSALQLLGEALRPAAPLRVRCAAAAAAVWLRWDAAVAALLARCDDGDARAALALHASLHAHAAHAVAGGEAPAVRGALAPTLAPLAAASAAAATALDAASAVYDCPALAAAAAAATAGDGNRNGNAALRAVALLGAALAPPPADADVASAREACYVAHLAFCNLGTWTAVSLLTLCGNLQQLVTLYRYVLHPAARASVRVLGDAMVPSPFYSRMLSDVRLHPLAWAASAAQPFSALSVPWPVVVAHVRCYVLLASLIRVPVHLALAGATLRLRRRQGVMPSYERTFLAFMLAEATFLLLIDVLVAHATSAAAQWFAAPAIAINVAAIVCLHLRGPFRPSAVILSLFYRMFALAAVMLLARGGGRVLLRDVSFLGQLAAAAFTVARAPRRDAAMRAAYDASLEQLTYSGEGSAAVSGKAKAE